MKGSEIVSQFSNFKLNQKLQFSELKDLLENNFLDYQVKIEVITYESSTELIGTLNLYKDGTPYKQCRANFKLQGGYLTLEAFNDQFSMKNRELSISEVSIVNYEPYIYNSVEGTAGVCITVDVSDKLSLNEK